jgi:hypothetical protein
MNAQPISTLVSQLVQATRSRASRPSQRNLEIYEEVHVKGKSQLEVGAFRGLSQSRVSAICRQVARWRGAHESSELGEPQGASKVRAERWLTRRRLEEVYGWTLRGLESSGQSLVSHVTQDRDDGPTRRTITRKEQNLNVQWAKVARATVNDLHKLAELDEPEAPPDTRPQLRQEQANRIVRLMACLRRVVRQASQAASPDCLRQVVEQIVQTVVAQASSSSFSQLEESAVATITPLATPESERANYSTFPAEKSDGAPEVTVAIAVASPSRPGTYSNPHATGVAPQNGNGRTEKSAVRTVSRGAHERPASHRSAGNESRSAHAEVEYYFGIAMRPEEIAAQLKELRAIQAGRYRMFEFSRQQAEALERWDRAHQDHGASTAAK